MSRDPVYLFDTMILPPGGDEEEEVPALLLTVEEVLRRPSTASIQAPHQPPVLPAGHTLSVTSSMDGHPV